MLQRVVSFVLGIALLIAAFFFASIIFAIAAILALIIWGWLMWRTRHLRREMERAEGSVIEGEYRVERAVGNALARCGPGSAALPA
jgi:FtsH-binding integral membrane protein